MFSRRCGLVVVMLILLASQGLLPEMIRAESPPAPAWEPILWWLPEDTETLFVTQGSAALPRRALDEEKGLEPFQFLGVGPVLEINNGLLRQELAGQKVLCTVEGSRRFTTPSGLGMMPYHGCHILQFEAAADETLQKAFHLCLKKAGKQIEVGGEKVAVFTEKQEDDVWTYFLVRPRPGVLICATNQEYLEETLKRIARKPERRAFPETLPEWKHVDAKAGLWAIRHYRKEFAADDPSSPLRPKAAANVSDLAAVGFVFSYSPGKDTAHVRYLSGAKDAVKLATEGWHHPSESLSPEIKQVADGVVEISTKLKEERTAGMFVFVLLAYLGHAIYL